MSTSDCNEARFNQVTVEELSMTLNNMRTDTMGSDACTVEVPDSGEMLDTITEITSTPDMTGSGSLLTDISAKQSNLEMLPARMTSLLSRSTDCHCIPAANTDDQHGHVIVELPSGNLSSNESILVDSRNWRLSIGIPVHKQIHRGEDLKNFGTKDTDVDDTDPIASISKVRFIWMVSIFLNVVPLFIFEEFVVLRTLIFYNLQLTSSRMYTTSLGPLVLLITGSLIPSAMVLIARLFEFSPESRTILNDLCRKSFHGHVFVSFVILTLFVKAGNDNVEQRLIQKIIYVQATIIVKQIGMVLIWCRRRLIHHREAWQYIYIYLFGTFLTATVALERLQNLPGYGKYFDNFSFSWPGPSFRFASACVRIVGVTAFDLIGFNLLWLYMLHGTLAQCVNKLASLANVLSDDKLPPFNALKLPPEFKDGPSLNIPKLSKWKSSTIRRLHAKFGQEFWRALEEVD